MNLVDTHCHLDAEQFAGEAPEQIIARASDAGVARCVTIGTDPASSRAAIELAERLAPVSAAVGVDPHAAAQTTPDDLAAVEAMAGEPTVVAVGEIGLDYYWDKAPRPTQQELFREQLGIARRRDLPVVIHNRDADPDTESILLDWAGRRTTAGRPLGVMHCFSGSLAMARRLVDAGFLISFAGNVTYRSAERLREVATGLPESAIVLETDAPFLAPIPHRGTVNEPARVRDIATFLAELRGTTLEALARVTSANAARLFGWDAA